MSGSLDKVTTAGMMRFIIKKSDAFGIISENSFTTVNLTISLA